MCEKLRAEFNESLPTDQTKQQHEEILRHMEANDWNEMWLAYTLVVFEEAKWLNGQKVDPDLVYGTKKISNGACGYLNARDGRLELGHCGSKDFGYICPKYGCDHCPAGTLAQECIKLNGTCYLVGCGAKHWHDARNKCLSFGSDLAGPLSSSTRDNLAEYIQTKMNSQKNIKYWVGIKLADWSADVPTTTDPLTADFSRWSLQQPVTGMNCSVVVRQGNTLSWRAGPCSDKHHFHCFKAEAARGSQTENSSPASSVTIEETITRGPSPSFSTGGPTPAGTPPWAVWVFVLLALLLVAVAVLIALAIYMIYRRWWQGRRDSNDRSGEDRSGEEESMLSDVQETRITQDNQHETILIDSGINSSPHSAPGNNSENENTMSLDRVVSDLTLSQPPAPAEIIQDNINTAQGNSQQTSITTAENNDESTSNRVEESTTQEVVGRPDDTHQETEQVGPLIERISESSNIIPDSALGIDIPLIVFNVSGSNSGRSINDITSSSDMSANLTSIQFKPQSDHFQNMASTDVLISGQESEPYTAEDRLSVSSSENEEVPSRSSLLMNIKEDADDISSDFTFMDGSSSRSSHVAIQTEPEEQLLSSRDSHRSKTEERSSVSRDKWDSAIKLYSPILTNLKEDADNISSNFTFSDDSLSVRSTVAVQTVTEECHHVRPEARYQKTCRHSLSSENSNYNLAESDAPPPYTEISDISVQSTSKARFHDQKMYIEESQNNRISGHSRPDKTVVMRLLNEDFELIIPPCTEELFAMSVIKAEDPMVPHFLSQTKGTIVQLLFSKKENRICKITYKDDNLWNEYFCRWSEQENDDWNEISKDGKMAVLRTPSSVDIQTYSPGRYLVIQRKIPSVLRPHIQSQYRHPYLSIEIRMCHPRSPLFRGLDNEDEIVSFLGKENSPVMIEMEISIDLFDQEEWVIRDTDIAHRVSKNLLVTKPYQGYNEPIPRKPVASIKLEQVVEVDGSFECSFKFRCTKKHKKGENQEVTIPHKVSLSRWHSDSSYIS